MYRAIGMRASLGWQAHGAWATWVDRQASDTIRVVAERGNGRTHIDLARIALKWSPAHDSVDSIGDPLKNRLKTNTYEMSCA
jgi:hypothetical protein